MEETNTATIQNQKEEKYAELWGDRVVLSQLLIASIIGITLTMLFYLLASKYFLMQPNLDEGLAKGYSLMIGILGCILSGIISSKLFKPKRIVIENADHFDINDAIKTAGSTLEQEAKAIQHISKQSVDEMKVLGLDALLEIKSDKEGK